MNKKLNLGLSLLFIIIMMSLYISFLFFSAKIPVAKVEYAGIVVCFLFSWAVFCDKVDTWLVRLAFLFTLISDWFLVIKQDQFVLALITFSIAQVFYATRLWINDGKRKNGKHIYLRIAIIALVELVAVFITKSLTINFDLQLFLALLYFTLLVMNVILAFMQMRKNILFTIGMLLFLGCDIMVGLSKFGDYLTLSESSIIFKLLNFPVDLVWFFYFPSQTLLALSILTYRKNENKTT